MSWYVDLIEPSSVDEDGDVLSEYTHQNWNYTHNCNTMIKLVMSENAEFFEPWTGPDAGDEPWWIFLDGCQAQSGADFLDLLIAFLGDDPDKYICMNPEFSWGDYASLVTTLKSMRNYCDENARHTWLWRATG